MKRILKCLLFIIVFAFLLNRFSLLFVKKGNGYGTDVLNFYQQKKNSIDILFLGSSHAYSAFNPYVIEEITNLKGYAFSTQQQPSWITYYYLKEALKYQNPEFIVFDVHMLTTENDYASEAVNRDAIDKMKFSINKIEAINTSVEKFNDRFAYYFNIIKYHTRYKELNDRDWDTVFHKYSIDNKGYIGLPTTDYKFDISEIEKTNKVLPISEKNEKFLRKIIKTAQDNHINLILVKTPASYSKNDLKQLNYIEQIALANNIPFLNYIKDIESLDLDYDLDFYDSGHLNYNGSVRFSKVFSNYILSVK